MIPSIEFKGVSKFFGNIIALKDISFKVFKGEITALLGDNGAGKSTLIKLLSGVHIPSEGEILLSGEPVNFKSPRQAVSAGIGTVYQDLALQPLMSVTRNFFLGREITKGLFLNMPLMNRLSIPELFLDHLNKIEKMLKNQIWAPHFGRTLGPSELFEQHFPIPNHKSEVTVTFSDV